MTPTAGGGGSSISKVFSLSGTVGTSESALTWSSGGTTYPIAAGEEVSFVGCLFAKKGGGYQAVHFRGMVVGDNSEFLVSDPGNGLAHGLTINSSFVTGTTFQITASVSSGTAVIKGSVTMTKVTGGATSA